MSWLSQSTNQTFQALAERRSKVASKGGELLGAALNLVGELVANDKEPNPAFVAKVERGLTGCTEPQADGRLSLRLDLPNQDSLNQLAKTLVSQLVSASQVAFSVKMPRKRGDVKLDFPAAQKRLK